MTSPSHLCLRKTWNVVLALVACVALVTLVSAVPSQTRAETMERAVMVKAGGAHTCALLVNRDVMCWGWNLHGQLGDGTKNDSPVPVRVNGVKNIIALDAGHGHNCVINARKRVKCWGNNFYGQLGDGTNEDRSRPVRVVGLRNVVALALGGGHTCALTEAGGVKCWGNNGDGQVGSNLPMHHSTPIDVVGLTSGVQALGAGLDHTCAVLSDGHIRCWGWNQFGQLGNGTTDNSPVPIQVSNITAATAVSGASLHTCAIENSRVKCWGSNDAGQLGDGTNDDHLTPTATLNFGKVKQLDDGDVHTCALTRKGAAKCWGGNGAGALGNGNDQASNLPVQVRGIQQDALSISAGNVGGVGASHSCAVVASGQVKCWGKNDRGQLGDGTEQDSNVPVSVIGFE